MVPAERGLTAGCDSTALRRATARAAASPRRRALATRRSATAIRDARNCYATGSPRDARRRSAALGQERDIDDLTCADLFGFAGHDHQTVGFSECREQMRRRSRYPAKGLHKVFAGVLITHQLAT